MEKSGFLDRNKLLLAVAIAAFASGSLVCFLLGFPAITGHLSAPGEGSGFAGPKTVTKVIDGDTVIIEGEPVRLLGIDADERGYPCYSAAKKRLEELLLNKEVYLERDETDKDQYGRYLRHLFLNGRNINLQLVEEGLAVARFSAGNVKYKKEIIDAERQAREGKTGCKWGATKEEETPRTPNEHRWSRLTPSLTGLDVIDACNAGSHTGRKMIVEGEVADSYRYRTTSIFLNFGKPYPHHCFTAIIWSSDWERFPENAEKYYKGKTVRIMGEIKKYRGKPEIILRDPSQIEVGR